MQLLDVSVFNGGGNIAGFTNDNSYRLKSLINYAKKYSAYIQKCADNFGEETLGILDEYTENYGGLAGFKTAIDNNDNKIVTINYWTWQGLTFDDLTLKGTLDFSVSEKTRRMYDKLKLSYKEQKQSDLIKGNICFSADNDYVLYYIW